jgi:signal transduction histidine kinase
VFSIVIAFSIFVIAWNTRRFMDNNYLLFIGMAYLCVGGIDLLHTLAYAGMGVFPGAGANLPTQLWISARYVESAALLLAPLFLRRKLRTGIAFAGIGGITFLLLVSIFYWKLFPTCFVEGVGLTPFKKVSEYAICLILFGSIGTAVLKKNALDPHVLKLLIASIAVTIVAELAFTLYVSAYGFSNLVGHYFKILSFYLIYLALIHTGLREPYRLLFRNLSEAKDALQYRMEFENLISEISSHFISVPTESIDNSIEEALEQIGRFAGVDGGYVFRFSDDMSTFSMTHLWRNENIATRKDDLQSLDAAVMPWWTRKLAGNEPIIIKSLDDFPPEAGVEKSILAAQKIQSAVDVPMVNIGTVIGFLGFSCVQMREWTEDEVSLLQMAGQAITNALQRKWAEEALRNSETRYRVLSENLDREVRKKVAELQQAEHLAAIGKIVSTVAHEVRNPLQNIRMGVNLLDRELGPDDDRREILTDIDHGVGILNSLIEELLEYARPVKLQRAPVSVSTVVDDAVKMTSHKVGDRNLHRDLTGVDRQVFVDPVKIGRVLVNLISNAADATPKGGDIWIRADDFRNGDTDFLRLTISDTGCGIDEKSLDRIFEPFFTTKTRGTGLGLCICKRIMDAHDGTLNIRSKVNEGTNVEIMLPVPGSCERAA